MARAHKDVDPKIFKHYVAIEVCRHVWRMPFLRNIFFVCLIIALFFPLYNWIYISPAFRNVLTAVKVQDAERTAACMTRMIALVHQTQTTLTLIAVIMMIIVAMILYKAGEAMLRHHHMDDELESARTQLEKRVAERTTELLKSNKELQLEIIERRQAEENLRKAEKESQYNLNFMNTLIDTIPNPVFCKDTQGYYLRCNVAYAETLGRPKKDIMGRRLIDIALEKDQDMSWHYHQQDLLLMKKAGVQSHESQVQCADGTVRDYIIYKATFKDTEGKVAGLVGIMLDISSRIASEQRRQHLELQLQQAQKMEALGTLAGGIAHDFNNILAAIIGYSEIVVSEITKDSDLYHYVERVLEAGERARSLVKQILTFSRQSENEPRPIQIKIIVKEVLKLLRASLPVTIEIVQKIQSDATVMADPVQIHQVMMNLCTNAGYAMREKGGTLTVGLENVELNQAFVRRHADLKAGPYLKLSVIDTGVGIAPENLNRIFDPFFTTKPKNEGTGMGLSVVHGIVTHLGGIITVRSEPGKGACFDIYLPVIKDKADLAYSETRVIPSGTERLLFVDDEIFQTDMLKHMLSLLGYKVETMNSSLDALAWFKKEPNAVDLVITDMIMPKLTGAELAEQMLKIRPDLPIIICTGYSENFTEAQAKALGVRAFVLKPMVMEELARLIRNILDGVTPDDNPQHWG